MSFFSDFVTGAAESASGEIGRRQAEQTKIEAEQRQQDLAIERERVVSEMKAKMAEEQAAAKTKRTSEQMAAVDAAAPAVTRERQLAEMQARAPSATGDTMDIVRKTLGPAEMQKYYGVEDNVVSRLGDKLGVARKAGYGEAEAQLKTSYDETVKVLKMEQDEADRVRKDETANKRIETTAATAAEGQAAMLERMDIQGRNQLAAINARGANGGGSGDDTKAFNALTQAENALTRKIDGIKKSNKLSDIDALSPLKVAEHERKLEAMVDNDPQVKSIRSHIQRQTEALSPEVKSAPKPATPTPAPAGKTSAPMRYKPGQTQVVQSGPHKGKTATWDGKGWSL